MGRMTERMSEVIGYTMTDLDGRFEVVRTAESNLGNLVCDLIRQATGTDIVIINGGVVNQTSLRGRCTRIVLASLTLD